MWLPLAGSCEFRQAATLKACSKEDEIEVDVVTS